MQTSSILLLLALVASALSLPTDNKCKPGINCRLPGCRCWDDPSRPGRYEPEATPQMIILTFSGALNKYTTADYLPLFANLSNPNGCPAKGTFFVQDLDTSVETVKHLYSLGHEIGLSASNGSSPIGKRGWAESFFKSMEKANDAGISRKGLVGVRAPNLNMGGNEELEAEMNFGLQYEASCVLQAFDSEKQMLWPFTYDFVEQVPQCGIGKTPNQQFAGLWQFLIPEMTFKGHVCSTLSSCSPYIQNYQEAFAFLYNTFRKHYSNSRAPMVIYIDLLWLKRPDQVKGLVQFLEVVNRYEDTWLISLAQALDWIREPVPFYPSVKFTPWECSKEEKLANRH